MEHAEHFYKKVEEVNKILKDGWDILEGPYAVGSYICIKFVRPDQPSMSGELSKYEDHEDHEW